jgi:hypothetical protein
MCLAPLTLDIGVQQVMLCCAMLCPCHAEYMLVAEKAVVVIGCCCWKSVLCAVQLCWSQYSCAGASTAVPATVQLKNLCVGE